MSCYYKCLCEIEQCLWREAVRTRYVTMYRHSPRKCRKSWSEPYFGSIIVTGGLFVVGIVQGGVVHAGQMSGASLVITSVEGWLLTPALMGKAERMSALAVFLGLR